MFQEQNLLNYPVLEGLLETRSAHTPGTVPPGDSLTSQQDMRTRGRPSGQITFNPPVNRVMINNPTFYAYHYARPEDHASLISAKGVAVPETPPVEKAEPKLSHKRSNTIYETQLMCKGRGFPLWVPQPNMRLPVAQRAKGVSIGDVGIITEYGAFDFLFNICIPADDPEKINPTDLPDGFTTLELKPWDVREFRDFPNGSYLASPTVGKAIKGEDRRTTTFESSAEESALLAMPEGAHHEEVNDLSKFRDYAEKHVESWYDFVLHRRGRRDTANGDIRLVVGVDKSSSWGIASFSEPFKLQLKESEDVMTTRDSPYTWEHTGRSGEVKAGPDRSDNWDVYSTAGDKAKNQTLFVRTLNILLEKETWKAITGKGRSDPRDRNYPAAFGFTHTPMGVSRPALDLAPTPVSTTGGKRPRSPTWSNDVSIQAKSWRPMDDEHYGDHPLTNQPTRNQRPDTTYLEEDQKVEYMHPRNEDEALLSSYDSVIQLLNTKPQDWPALELPSHVSLPDLDTIQSLDYSAWAEQSCTPGTSADIDAQVEPRSAAGTDLDVLSELDRTLSELESLKRALLFIDWEDLVEDPDFTDRFRTQNGYMTLPSSSEPKFAQHAIHEPSLRGQSMGYGADPGKKHNSISGRVSSQCSQQL